MNTSLHMAAKKGPGYLLLVTILLLNGCNLLSQSSNNIDVAYNQQMHTVISRVLKPGSNGIDVGCYKGEILKAMVKAAPQGKHFAFEPIPHLSSALKKEFNGSSAKIFEVALGEKSGETTFTHVVSNEAYSGFKKREYASKDEVTKKIKVRVEPLDKLVPKDMPVSLIKIDVEGAELQVLKGARETIRRNKPVIIFEHGQGSSEFYKTKPEDVYKLLHDELGLSISLMERWLDGKKALTRKEFLEHYYQKKAYNYIAYPM